MRSSGMSNLRIARPYLIIAFLCTAFALLSNVYLIPESFRQFRDFEYRLRNELSDSAIKPGTFNPLKGMTIYVKEKDSKGRLDGVMIYIPAKEMQNATFISAQSGYFNKENGHLILHLLEGNRQEWDATHKTRSSCGFETFSYDLTAFLVPSGERHIKPLEKPLTELLHPETKTSDLTTQRRLKVEGHQRLMIPLLCLTHVLIFLCMILSGDLQRRQRKKKMTIALVGVFSFHLFVMLQLNLATRFWGLLLSAYALIFLCIGGCLLWLSQNNLLRRLKARIQKNNVLKFHIKNY